jgi:SAM-dependent methyltransferase
LAIRDGELAYFTALAARKGYHGRLMTFGRTSLNWPGAPTSEELYRDLGFDEVHSMDVSPYQGAGHIHDLNDPRIADDLKGQYDFVIASGTLEHVFHWHNAVKVAFDLLKIGGTLVFGSPANNWTDHGFYQFSPTLKFDLFADNGWEFGESLADLDWPGQGPRRTLPLYPRESGFCNTLPARCIHSLDVVKVAGAACDRIPTQSLYAQKFGGEARRFRFLARAPLDLVDGQIAQPPARVFPLDARRIEPSGNGYRIRFSDRGAPPSLAGRPFRSTALIYEDDRLLPWIVSDPAMVGERPGSFTHFGPHIHFTPTDGADPRANDKTYRAAFPSYPWRDGV